MSFQFCFSNVPVTLDSQFKGVLVKAAQKVPDDTEHFRLLMRLADGENALSDMFLLNVRQAKPLTFMIEYVFCLSEADNGLSVWAYLSSAGGMGSPLALSYCNRPLSLEELILYWQQQVLADIAVNDVDIAMHPEAVDKALLSAQQQTQRVVFSE
ncbi:hypothetical protein [Alteromonas naphthalenivorans]|uniref:Uncharacterized protein n=1 Tax=Alteromonas naphthalenivorans TaxID=715451 RepID=F5Z5F4_ALTNA|nr:hypothetical protein [Alteromonas naphthalenivorans]AEF04880.1 hypothetical protein ambt_16875 [Alteromonas naphthalenivorans]